MNRDRHIPKPTRLYYWIMIALALLFLAVPIVILRIGPAGYKFYGPNIPDICIYGGFITGKDRRFWGINFAWKFQLMVVLYFIASTLYCVTISTTLTRQRILVGINLLLLVLFPVWLVNYIGGVECNSDRADLSLEPSIGWAVYLLLLLATIITFWRVHKAKPDFM